jgi:hypothetical protein
VPDLTDDAPDGRVPLEKKDAEESNDSEKERKSRAGVWSVRSVLLLAVGVG